MPLGDGSTWDETNPQQSTEANTLDSYGRDIRVGTRARMQNEHYWPSSQTATGQAGQHVFVSFQSQTAAPAFQVNNSGTSLQSGVLWIDTSNNLWFTSPGIGGTATNNVQVITNGTYGGSSLQYYPYIKCSLVQSSGTSGGTATSGAWRNIPLSNKDVDTASIAVLASNQITIPAGTYVVDADCTFGTVDQAQTQLYNITDSSTIILGEMTYNAQSNGTANVRSGLKGLFTIAASKTIAFQYQVQSTQAGSGLGRGSTGFGSNQTYAQITLTKVA